MFVFLYTCLIAICRQWWCSFNPNKWHLWYLLLIGSSKKFPLTYCSLLCHDSRTFQYCTNYQMHTYPSNIILFQSAALKPRKESKSRRNFLQKQTNKQTNHCQSSIGVLAHDQNRAFSCDIIATMLEGKNNTFSLLWEIRSIFMQNCLLFQPSNMAAMKTLYRNKSIWAKLIESNLVICHFSHFY